MEPNQIFEGTKQDATKSSFTQSNGKGMNEILNSKYLSNFIDNHKN